jgi:TRAP-type C4-dicarboxylate transport system substrate-binding protein
MKYYFIASIVLCAVTVSDASFAVTLKIATVSPEGATWMVKMREGAKEIKQRTQGRVKFKFYSGGVMGSDDSVLRKIKIGQLHGGAVTGGSLIDIYPELIIYSLPFVFRSFEEVDMVREKLDPVLTQGLEERGFVTFGLAEGGFAYLMSNKRVESTDDLKNQKVGVMSGDKLSQTVFESASVSPILLPISDVMTGLQTGLVDTVATSLIAAIALQWHTRVKYITDAPLSYFFAMLTVSKKAFDKIKPEDQAVVKQVMKSTFEKINEQNRIDNKSAREALEKQGVNFVNLSNEILENWKQTATQAIERFTKENTLDPSLLARIQEMLTGYRKTNSSVAAN